MASGRRTHSKEIAYLLLLLLAILVGVFSLRNSQDTRTSASESIAESTKKCVTYGDQCIVIIGTSTFVDYIQSQYNVHTPLPACGSFVLLKNGVLFKQTKQKCFDSYGWKYWKWNFYKDFPDGTKFCTYFTINPEQKACATIEK